MNFLKIAFLVPLIFLSFNFENGIKNKAPLPAKSSLSLHAEFLKEDYIQLPKQKNDSIADSAKVFYLNTILTNNSEETVYFLSMTCSHEDMFVVRDTELFKIYGHSDCSKNTPVLISLKPKENYQREIAIQSIVKETLIPVTTEVGFELVEYEKGKDFDIIESYRSRHSEGNTIWSNSFGLKNKLQPKK